MTNAEFHPFCDRVAYICFVSSSTLLLLPVIDPRSLNLKHIIATHSVFMKNLKYIDILQNVHHSQIASA